MTSFSFESMPNEYQFATVLGAFVAVRWVLSTVAALASRALHSGKSPKSYGKWAIVTGATDGIGKAYAQELAKRGMSVLLISRTQSKLDAVKSEIEEACPKVSVDTLAIDFNEFGDAEKSQVADKIKAMGDVGMLVNNVGVSYPFPLYFHELSDDEVQSLLTLNLNSLTWMTRLVLPTMIEQKRGAILNIGSSAGERASPLLAGYSAAKGYVERFSESLHHEYKSKGIFVQCQKPYFVVSKLSKYRKPSLFVPSASKYVKCALSYLGGPAVAQPYWAHAIATTMFDALPQSIVHSRVMAFHLGIRKKGLAKRARLAAAKKDE
jgi:17beta-estradiol 17-dehydrogenase / very-long-chain 3-oxoacyl-CoA reductase